MSVTKNKESIIMMQPVMKLELAVSVCPETNKANHNLQNLTLIHLFPSLFVGLESKEILA